MSSVATLQVEIYRNGAYIRTELLSEAVIKIGKLPSSHLRLEDPTISRIHAIIERSEAGEITIIDLGSSCGTTVEGKRVSKHLLHSGDEVVVGGTLLRITFIEEVQESAVAEPEGWSDENGNWHDGVGGYYDPEGNYHSQHGGWYDTAGNYFDGEGGYYNSEGEYHCVDGKVELVRDVDLLSARYLDEYDSSGQGVVEVALLWNDHITAVNTYTKASRRKKTSLLTIGESKENTISLKHASIPDARFPLIQPIDADRVAVNFTDSMSGLFLVGEARYTLEEAVSSGLATPGHYGQGSYAVVLSPHMRLRLEFGPNTVLIHHATAPTSIPVGRPALSGDLMGAAVASFVLHALFMFVAFYLPPEANSFELNEFSMKDRFITQMTKPVDAVEEPEWLEKGLDAGEPEPSGEPMAGATGEAGKDDSKATAKKAAIRRNRVGAITFPKKATETGVLSVLGKSPSILNGLDDALNGIDPITAMGNNKGRDIGEARGIGAFGLTGLGRFGEGNGERSIGIGGPGGDGLASRDADGRRKKYGRGVDVKLDPKQTKVPSRAVGGAGMTMTGSLSKAIIRRVIRSRMREVKYCYEQELIKDKGLAGRVVMKFTISSTGRVVVASPSNNTVNAKVGSCISSKVRRWVFPQPEGGGIVVVTYPFVFSSK